MSTRHLFGYAIAFLLFPAFNTQAAIAHNPGASQIHVLTDFPNNPYPSPNNPHYWKNKKPYEGYWQQDVHYTINAILNEEDELINGQEILVQIFRHEETHKVIRAQIAFRTLAGDSWGVPTELSFAK